MMIITKKYLPTEGALLEKIIQVRLGSASKLDKESSHCVQHEIYQILFSLITLIEQGHGQGAKDIRIFHQHVLQVERDLTGAENFYQMTVKDFNSFVSRPLISQLSHVMKFEASEVFRVHQVVIENSQVTGEMLWGEIQEMAHFA